MAKFDDEFIQYTEEKGKSESKNLALSLSVQIILYILLLFFAIFFIWYTAFISTHKYYLVYGASMKNTLNSSLQLDDATGKEDAVYVNTIAKIKTFDIVVIKRPGKENIIKRAVGMEGDYVSVAVAKDESGNDRIYFFRIASGTDLSNFDDESARLQEDKNENGYSIFGYDEWYERFSKNNLIEVNGFTYEKDFYEKFLTTCSGTDENFFVSNSGLMYVKVPKGKVFCLGDNRGHSDDSRQNGFYNKSQVVGRAEILVYNHNFGKRLLCVIKYYFAEVEKFFAR